MIMNPANIGIEYPILGAGDDQTVSKDSIGDTHKEKF